MTLSTLLLCAFVQCTDPAGPYPELVQELGVQCVFNDGATTVVDVRCPGTPPGPCGWPVVVFIHGLGGTRIPQAPAASNYAWNGYLTITYDVRGQGVATGHHTYFGPRERWDLVEVLRLVEAKFPDQFDESRIGVTGSSQGGLLAWSMAAWGGSPLEPQSGLLGDYPQVAAIVPENCSPDYLANFAPDAKGVHCFTARTLIQGDVEFDPVLRKAVERDLRGTQWGSFATRLTRDGRDIVGRVPQVVVPTLAMAAYDDAVFPASELARAIAHLPPTTPAKLYLGTIGHQSPGNLLELAYRDWLKVQWFDHYLKGVANGIDASPRVEFAITPADPLVYLSPGSLWSHDTATSWPPPDALATRLYLRAGGVDELPPATDEGQRELSQTVAAGYDMDDVVNAAFGFNSVRNHIPTQPLMYDSAPLASALYLCGDARVHLSILSDDPRWQVRASLWDVDPLGAARYVCGGSHFTWDDLAPGAAEVEFELNSQAYVWQAGHRLRVQLENLAIHQPPFGDSLRFGPYTVPFEVQVRSAPQQLSWVELSLR